MVDHDVFRLYISVNYSLGVEIFNSKDQRTNVELRVIGTQQTDISDDIEKFHTLDIFNQEVNVIGILEGFDELHDEGEVNDFQYSFFLLFRIKTAKLILLEDAFQEIVQQLVAWKHTSRQKIVRGSCV